MYEQLKNAYKISSKTPRFKSIVLQDPVEAIHCAVDTGSSLMFTEIYKIIDEETQYEAEEKFSQSPNWTKGLPHSEMYREYLKRGGAGGIKQRISAQLPIEKQCGYALRLLNIHIVNRFLDEGVNISKVAADTPRDAQDYSRMVEGYAEKCIKDVPVKAKDFLQLFKQEHPLLFSNPSRLFNDIRNNKQWLFVNKEMYVVDKTLEDTEKVFKDLGGFEAPSESFECKNSIQRCCSRLLNGENDVEFVHYLKEKEGLNHMEVSTPVGVTKNIAQNIPASPELTREPQEHELLGSAIPYGL